MRTLVGAKNLGLATVGALSGLVGGLAIGAGGRVAAGATVTQVPCVVNGPTGLIAAIDAANTAGGGTLDLAHGCTYTLTQVDNPTDGGNGLPVLAAPITIAGSGGTKIDRSAAPGTPDFRILEVAEGAT